MLTTNNENPEYIISYDVFKKIFPQAAEKIVLP